MTMPPQQNLASRTAEIGAFKHDPRNPRLHPEENLDAIRKSLARFGQVMPILVSVGTMEVIGGNATLQCMRDLGFTHVHFVEWSGTEQEQALLRIMLNRTAELATWDWEIIAQDLARFDRDGLALSDWGWSEDELNPLRQSAWFQDAKGALEDHNRTFNGGGSKAGVSVITIRGQDEEDFARAATKLRELCGEDGKKLHPGACVGRLARFYLEAQAAAALPPIAPPGEAGGDR